MKKEKEKEKVLCRGAGWGAVVGACGCGRTAGNGVLFALI